MIKKSIKKESINDDYWYNLKDIHKLRMIPWVSSIITLRKIVEKDIDNNNILKPVITGIGKGKKYSFKGENIIKFINLVEQGKVKL